MAFSKSYPRQSKMGVQWEESILTDEEENEVEILARAQNNILMKVCLADAKEIVKEVGMKDYQTDLVHIAISLFEKRASHEVYWKENKAKEKFDRAK